MTEPLISLLRYRVVNRITGAEITNNLPHLHQSFWKITAMQPGNPSSTATGSFTIPLYPPNSEAYAAAAPIYRQLRRYQRIEAYISHDGASLGKLYQTGAITGINETETSNTLTGETDLVWAKLSRPFSGEWLGSDVTSSILKSYLGTNELGFSDTFATYTAANYVSTFTAGGSAGTWTGSTDDGFGVVTCSTGGAALLSKNGAAANDRWHSHYIEVTGRLQPSADTANAGAMGIGLSDNAANLSTGVCVLGKMTAYKAGNRWNLNAITATFSANVLTSTYPIPNALSNVDDPDGYIALTLGLLIDINVGGSTMTLTCNGQVVARQTPTGWDPGTATMYPFLHFVAPATGTANAYFFNLRQLTRFTTDGPSTAAVFGNGTISTATHSLQAGVDPGPTFLEVWSRLATREGWYWRYTPRAYVAGSRTLGTVDFAADPGTDRSSSVIFSKRDGTLLDLQLTDNADPFATDTALIGQSTLDGGGLSIWSDFAAMTTDGVIQDEALAFTHPDFNSLRRASYQKNRNKVSVDSTGSKTAIVLRDPRTADVWRELDKVMIDAPERGINRLVARVVGYTFTEGQPTQTLTLDQFSAG